jgi:glucose/arabinose dehydrogenase
MTQARARRHGFAALSVAAAMLVGAGTSALTLGAEEGTDPEASASPAAQEVPEASLAPEATPYPAWDPSTVKIRTDVLVDGIDTPVYLTDDGAGSKCMYVVERAGIVRMIDPDGYTRPKPFLKIGKLVSDGAEQGLHAIAFHPQFKKNGRFFAHYNDAFTGASVIAEFKGSPCAPANSRPVRQLLKIEQPFVNNNGGWIGFGPDGYLYIALGDGGGISPGDPNGYGQAKSTRLSKMLRIDVNKGKFYGIPKSNPYAKKKKGFPRETWAMGLRDPRRASFDRKTGDLWIGDVGQDRFEEVNRIPAGAKKLNFGWSHMEGDQCHNLPDCDATAYALPVHFYDQVSPHRAITGGYVYRGSEIPELDGVYLFSDFASGYIWGLDADAVADGQPAIAHLLLDAPQGFVSFGEDDAGELYAVALDGSVYRIVADQA